MGERRRVRGNFSFISPSFKCNKFSAKEIIVLCFERKFPLIITFFPLFFFAVRVDDLLMQNKISHLFTFHNNENRTPEQCRMSINRNFFENKIFTLFRKSGKFSLNFISLILYFPLSTFTLSHFSLQTHSKLKI